MNKLPMAGALRAVMGLVLALACSAASAAWQHVADIADLSLEQLTRVTVTSVSRRAERILDAPASIFVISAEDIHRSGATSLPEALRLAPNLQVVQGDSSQFIISARGGLAGTANKMLVLIDGRTIYTPLFAGVFWDAQDTLMEDIERIEVISGPGSTLWGANAVNGVINIITKASSATRGTLAAAGGGDKQRGAAVREGVPLPDGGDMRVYAKYSNLSQNRLASGASARDDAERWQVGFRGDASEAARSATLQGDVYAANVDNLGGPRTLSGANLLGRWHSTRGPDDEWALQAYYDYTERRHEGTFHEKRDTFDLEFQHSMRMATGSRLVWGGGQRISRDRTEPTAALGFIPPGRTLRPGSLFVESATDLARGLSATLGLRAEHNSYTGVEWLPNARLAWLITPDQLAWSALTRATRAPSRIDRDLVVPGSPPFVINANDTFQSEVANVAEVGYRATLSPGISVSFTAFHHDMSRLRSLEPGAAGLQIANGATGRISGLEGWGDWTVTPDWRIVWGFVAMSFRTQLGTGHVNLTEDPLGNNPRRTASLRSLWNVTPSHKLDVVARHVGALPNPSVPSYTVLDARWGWQLNRQMELSLLLSNAFDKRHIEFTTPSQAAYLGRSTFLKVTWTP